MRIDSILPNHAPPGQSVIIQGDDVEAAERVFFGDQEASFDVDGQTLLVTVPDGAGTVDVTVEGADGQSDLSSFTITQS